MFEYILYEDIDFLYEGLNFVGHLALVESAIGYTPIVKAKINRTTISLNEGTVIKVNFDVKRKRLTIINTDFHFFCKNSRFRLR